MAARRRAAAGKRWSATASVALYNASRTRLADGATVGVQRAKVRWRIDGRQRKRTFDVGELGELSGFLAVLRAAYEQDWEPDERGRPIVPSGLPGLAPSTAAAAPAGNVDHGAGEKPEDIPPETVTTSRPLPGLGAQSTAVRNVADAGWPSPPPTGRSRGLRPSPCG